MKKINPRMHSAEHILNQTMIRLFQCERCFSAHIEDKKSKCDYYFSKPLAPEETVLLEKEVNNIIIQNLPVTFHFLPRGEAVQQYNMKKVPDDAGDMIRIVSIGTYDHCPCIGPHVTSTKEIGTFRIISTDFRDGVLRIRFKLLP